MCNLERGREDEQDRERDVKGNGCQEDKKKRSTILKGEKVESDREFLSFKNKEIIHREETLKM